MAKKQPDPSLPDRPDAPANPTRVTTAQAAELLTREGKTTITTAMIEADLKAGAPTNPDGTINLVQYAAWILKQGE